MNKKNNQGFTLIEVLIAAIILFSGIAITAELYNASVLSADKASTSVNRNQALNIAIHSIKTQLRQQAENKSLTEINGNVEVLGYDFQWSARRTKFQSRAMEISDTEPPTPQFGLFEVEIGLEGSANNRQIKVVTW